MRYMDINKEIKRLESIYLEKPEGVFSMYLNTDPADPDQQGGEWRIHLKNSLQQFEKYLKEDGNSEEIDNFNKVRKKVRDFFGEHETNLQKSVIIFATPDESIWFAEILQVPVETEIHWEKIARVDQLIELNQKHPKSGVIMTQREAIKIIETELGSQLDSYSYELDLDTEDWKKHVGPHRAQTTVGSGGKSLKRERYDKRFEANRYRWYKKIGGKLDKLAKDNGWEYIYMIGNQDETKDLSSTMNKPIDRFIDKNMHDKNEENVFKLINEK